MGETELAKVKKLISNASPALSVLVVDEDTVRAAIIEAGLRAGGHEEIIVIHDLNRVARTIADVCPDVIVIDIQNPNRDMLENLFQLSRSVQRPIAMFVDQTDKTMMEAAIDAGVSAYIVNGLAEERVKPILDMAISRFNAYSRMARELADAKSALEHRKIIERAKGLIMASRKIGEPAAYALLRSTAMNQNRTIADVAQSLVMAAGLLEP